MLSLFQNSLFAIIFGVLLGGIIVFAWISIYWKDKYLKTRDELMELANKNGFFTKKTSVMRKDEKQLFDILIKAIGSRYYIFPQMALSNILDVKNEFKDHDNLYREIDHRSLDFVIFDKENMSPLLVIELNGESHWFQMSRKNRDKLIKNILNQAKINYLSIQKAQNYDVKILTELIEKNLIQLNLT